MYKLILKTLFVIYLKCGLYIDYTRGVSFECERNLKIVISLEIDLYIQV